MKPPPTTPAERVRYGDGWALFADAEGCTLDAVHFDASMCWDLWRLLLSRTSHPRPPPHAELFQPIEEGGRITTWTGVVAVTDFPKGADSIDDDCFLTTCEFRITAPLRAALVDLMDAWT